MDKNYFKIVAKTRFKALLCISFYLFFCKLSIAQTEIKGVVKSTTGFLVNGAQVYSIHQQNSVKTDSLGQFKLNVVNDSAFFIYVSHPNYFSDSFWVKTKELLLVIQPIQEIKKVTIKAESTAKTSFIGIQAIKTEIITSGELKKAACCDLAGCFETQGTVQPTTTNVITNSKELRILGLSGVYNQVLLDGMPMIQGLTYTYGISNIPGTLVENIFVVKGSTSVLQGYESMVGQINVLTKKSDKGDKLLLNAYVNSFGEHHYNLNFRFGKKKWSNMIALHTVQPAQKWDRDQDDFMDLPQLKRYMIFNKWSYGNENLKGFSLNIGTRLVWEQRNGGQLNYNYRNNKGSQTVYGQLTNYTQGETYIKSGYRFNDKQKISLMTSGFKHNQNTWFGTVEYLAKQNNFYANLQYELDWSYSHELKAGLSFRHLNLQENISFSDTFLKRTYNGNYSRKEFIPGVFAENIFKWKGDILTLITGFRADRHQEFGWNYTPRTMLKYDIDNQSTIRASLGTGWRTVNLFSENIGILVSSRNIIFKEPLKPEKALNWGLNYLRKYKYKKINGVLTVDFYQTRFQNQFFPDFDTDPQKILVQNFEGRSISNGFQTDFSVKWNKLIEFKVAYNFLDVYRVMNETKIQLPFNAKHKFLASLSYIPKKQKWRIDLNGHWFGKQRLPNTESNPIEFRQQAFSKSFVIFNMQATKQLKRIEVYLGCENILDFRQKRPIVSWQNPFGQYFDASFNWGPTRGREFYIGIRFKPFEK